MFSLVKKLAPVCAAAAVIAATVTPALAARSHYGNRFSLLVYTHMQDPEGALIQQLANTWAANNGGTVKVVVDKGSLNDFAQLAHSNRGPDIMFGAPDDETGNYQAAGLLAPVPAGTFDPSKVVPAAVNAVNYGGQYYAVPLDLDTYALVYNKKLIHSVPRTWDQLLAAAATFPNKKGQTYGFLYGLTTPYYSYAFVRGFGGYIFKQTSSGLNTADIGLGNAGTVKALAYLKSFVDKKIMPADIDYNTAQGLFQKGQLAMFIDGTWDIGANRKALGKNFAVAPWPTLPGGGQPHQFAGVWDAFVSAFSNNKDIAFKFIKDIAPQYSMPDLRVGGRIPVLKSDLDSPTVTRDPVLMGYARAAAAGDPLPNSPAMAAVWTPLQNGITLVVTGKTSPQAAAANMVKQVKQGIAQQGSQ